MAQSKRIYDHNSWYEIPDNPISKVGVFPYRGSSIGAPDPDKIYMVYRPAEELGDEECMASFRLLPIVDDHEMLGGDYTAAEEKGVHGIIGENIAFNGTTLLANIKIFSDDLNMKVESGKRELSAGYRCFYKPQSGVYMNEDGIAEPYDYIQTKIRGNHLALVNQGRMGKDVAVMDEMKITFDAKEAVKMADEIKKVDEVEKDTAKDADEPKKDDMKDEPKDDPKKDAKDEDEKKSDAKDEDDKDKKKGEGMDASVFAAMDAQIKSMRRELDAMKSNGTKTVLSEVSKRDALASKLSEYIGTFDHADKTLDEVAKYGVKKLGLDVADGQESAVLAGYFHNRAAPSKDVFGMDSVDTTGVSAISKFFN